MAIAVRVARTDELDAATLGATRALLEDVFPGDLTEEDWRHCLGGTHALAFEDGAPVAHASVVERTMWHDGRALRVGYVEGVGVRPDRRGRGLGAAVMAPLEDLVRAAFDAGALGPTDEAVPFYDRRGWELWRGGLSQRTPDGAVQPSGEEAVYVLRTPAAPLDLDGELTCDWRAGDVW